MSDITTVAVLGTGVLGSQIAFQTAYSGFDVIAYDISDEALAAAKERFQRLVATYKAEVPGAARGKADETLGRLTLTTDLAEASTAPCASASRAAANAAEGTRCPRVSPSRVADSTTLGLSRRRALASCTQPSCTSRSTSVVRV